MTEVRVDPWEDIDTACRRFKRLVMQAGITAEVKKRRSYYKPSEVIRKKRRATIRRLRRDQQREAFI